MKNETQQTLEQQPITEQQVLQSPADKQQQEEKRRINQVKEQHGNGDNMPFVLPFDSHNNTDYWIISETVK
jgi:hypothetical protein